MSTLDYISSAGISVLLRAHKRLSEQGQTLKFTNLSRRVRTVFQYAGLDTVLWVE
jgi:anti-anti-sigma factor